MNFPIHRTMLRSACLLGAALLPAAAGPAPAAGDPLDFVKTGKEVLARHGLDPGATGTLVFYEVLEKASVAVTLGPITLYLPKEAFRPADARGKGEAEAAAALQIAVPAALRALVQLGRWSGVESLDEKQILELTKAIEIGKDFDLSALDAPLGLAALLDDPGDKKIHAALEALDRLFAAPALAPKLGGEKAVPIPMAVLPTRRQMVEYLCLAGVVEPTLASAFHQPAITGWMHSYYGSTDSKGRVHLLCLEEGHTGDGALNTWTEPSQDTDPELARHTITYDALVALIGGQAAAVPNWFALGLAFEGVFAQYGRVAARLGADSVGDVTPPRQAFVPGGQSQGGQFPPNLSALRGTLGLKELRNFLAERKQAAYKLLEKRDAKDEQRKAARADDEVVYFNFRDRADSEEQGYLHFGPYLGQDVSFLIQKDVPYDLALIQRALFASAAAELAGREKGAAVVRLMTALPGAAEPFEELLSKQAGVTAAELERAVFEGLKKK